MQDQHKATRAAEERYRNELEAHAGAITALRQVEDSQDVSRLNCGSRIHAHARLCT